MKRMLFLGILSLFAAAHASELTASRTDVVMLVGGLRNDLGVVRAAAFRADDGWPFDFGRAYRTNKAKVEKGRARVLLDDLPYGTYAVALFHDENDNGVIDVNFFKVRVEGVAFSRNAPAGLEYPRMRDAEFEVYKGGATLNVTMQY